MRTGTAHARIKTDAIGVDPTWLAGAQPIADDTLVVAALFLRDGVVAGLGAGGASGAGIESNTVTVLAGLNHGGLAFGNWPYR